MKSKFLTIFILLPILLFSQVQYKAVKSTDTIVSVKVMHHHRHTIDSTNKEVKKAKDTVAVQGEIIKEQKSVIDSQQLWKDILGKMTPTLLLEVYFFAFLGMFIRWRRMVMKAVKTNPATPNKPNIRYWIVNNAIPKMLNLMMSIGVLFVFFRFTGELLNLPLTLFAALVMGFSVDLLVDKLMEINIKSLLTSIIKKN